MRRTRHALPLAILAGLLLALTLTGCSEDDTNPAAPGEESPVLPNADILVFDFSFFDVASELEDGKAFQDHSNFINAYARVVVLDLVARFIATPPMAAFAVALHTIPSLQDDGSWIWVYTHVDGLQEQQIRLRGLPVDDGVEWELRVTVGVIDNEVWFAGTTHNDGADGEWTFYELVGTEHPETARISWGRDEDGDFLRFEALAGDDAGDILTFHDNDPKFTITHIDASEDHSSFIEWWADGHGSLQVPDYNEGVMACWDADLRNVDCE